MSEQNLPPQQPVPNEPESSGQAGPAQPQGSYQIPNNGGQNVPPGNYPPPGGYQGAPYEPPQESRSATASFFDSIRRVGVVRSDQRWLGGVCGGVALRFRVDPVLVRVLTLLAFVILGLFSVSVVLFAYGLAWALLPEEYDGRIHLEEAFNRRFHAGFAGAVFCVLAGSTNFPSSSLNNFYFLHSDLFSFFFVMAVIAGFIAFLVWLSNHFSSSKPAPPQNAAPMNTMPMNAAPGNASRMNAMPQGMPTPPSAGRPTPPSAGMPTPSPAGSASGAAQMPPQQPLPPRTALPVRPVPPRPRVLGPGRRVYMLVFGLIALVLAYAFYSMSTGYGLLGVQFIAGGAIIALLGAALLYAGVRGRHGGWLTAISIPAVFFAVPAVIFGAVTPGSVMNEPYDAFFADDSTVVLDYESGDVSALFGDLTVDVTDMPADAEPNTINIDMTAGDIDIKTLEGQSVVLNINASAGSVSFSTLSVWSLGDTGYLTTYSGSDSDDDCYYMGCSFFTDGTFVDHSGYQQSGLNFDLHASSPAAIDTDVPTLTINVDLAAGDVYINETTDQVIWTGVPEETAWIVEYWEVVDDSLDTSEELPVPGMEHAAITAGQANQCVAEALGQSGSDEDGYSYIPEMSEKELDSYHECVNALLDEQSNETEEN